jgi:hypothetical protein
VPVIQRADAARAPTPSIASFRPSAGPGLPASSADQLARANQHRADSPLSTPTLGLQAMCASSCGCASCSQKRALALQRADAASTGAARARPSPEEALHQLGPGTPLPPAAADRYSHAYGRDLSGVRVHPESPAAAEMGARAFTVGHHIAFAPGQLQPGTPAGDHLLAHELAHVVQQSGGTGEVQGAGLDYDGYEAEADQAASVANRGGTVRRLTPVRGRMVQRGIGDWLEDKASAAWGGIKSGASAAWGGIKSGAKAVGGAIADVAEAGWDFLVDRFWDLVRAVAPEAEPYLRHPGKLWDLVKEAVGKGIDALFGGIFSAFKDVGIFGAATTFFKKFLPAIGKVTQAISRDDHAGLAKGVKEAIDAFGDMSDAMFAPIKKIFSVVSGALKAAFEKVALPIFDLLKSVAKGVWDAVSSFVDAVVSIAGKIGSVLGRVWKWIKSTLGFGGGDASSDSSDGWWERIKKWAGGLWDGIKGTVLKFVEPLKTLGKVLLMVSPVGPIILAFKYGPKIVHWLKDLWGAIKDPKNIPRARAKVLQILRGMTAFLQTVAAKLGALASDLQEKLEAISKPLAAVSEALGANAILKVLSIGIRWIAGAIEKGVKWVGENVPAFVNKVGDFFTKLWTWAKPVIDVLVRVIMVVANQLGIPMLVAGWVWGKLPVWLKIVIIVFVLEILIRFVSALPDGAIAAGAGPLAILIKHAILGFLKQILGEDGANVEKAVAAADRIAKLLQGGGIEFVGGYAIGLLSGIWDGIVGPIELVAMLIEGFVSIAEWLDRASSTFPADIAALFGKVKGLATSVKGQAWPAIKSVFSGEGGGGMGKVLALLKSAFGAVTGAAASIGATIADALIKFIMLPDYELGKKLGWVAGTVIFEVALAVLTGGASAALKAASGPLARILKMIVKMHEYMGKVFEEILHFLPGVQRTLERAMSAIAEMPALKPILASLKSLFKELESASARALGKLGGEAAAEGTAAAARGTATVVTDAEKTAAKVESKVGGAEARAEGAAAKPHEDPAPGPAKPREEPPPRNVDETKHLEGPQLTQKEIDKELQHIRDNPHLVEGTPPNRRAKVGDHEWVEQPGGGWCRHSDPTKVVCAVPSAAPVSPAAAPPAAPASPAPRSVEEIQREMASLEKLKSIGNKRMQRYLDLEAELDRALGAKYAPRAGETPAQTSERLFGRQPGESVPDWKARLKAMEDEAARGASLAKNEDLYLRDYQAKVAEAEAQLARPGQELAAAQEAQAAAKAKAEAAQEAVDRWRNGVTKWEDRLAAARKKAASLSPRDPALKDALAEIEAARAKLATARSELSAAQDAASAARVEKRAADRTAATAERGAKELTTAEREALRAGTPSGKTAQDFWDAHPGTVYDSAYPKVPIGERSIDHIVPANDIMKMDNFNKLTTPQRREILDLSENLAPMEKRINSSRGDTSWHEWKGHPDFGEIDPAVRKAMAAKEDALRKKIQDMINNLVGK